MGFSIDYGFGFFGGLFIAMMAIVAVIVLFFLFTAARTARRDVLDEEHDRREAEGEEV